MNPTDLLQKISDAIQELNSQKISSLVKQALDEEMDVATLINSGLTAGLRKLGVRFEKSEVFLPELMKGAQIVQTIINELDSKVKKDAIQTRVKFMIGTVAEDLHDVGKNIVSTVFSSAGYKVIDLGINVPTERFVEQVRTQKPELLGLSALLTTTMANQRRVIEALEAEGLRKNVKIIVGGAPVSSSWAKQINADAYAEDAFSGLKRAEELIN